MSFIRKKHKLGGLFSLERNADLYSGTNNIISHPSVCSCRGREKERVLGRGVQKDQHFLSGGVLRWYSWRIFAPMTTSVFSWRDKSGNLYLQIHNHEAGHAVPEMFKGHGTF